VEQYEHILRRIEECRDRGSDEVRTLIEDVEETRDMLRRLIEDGYLIHDSGFGYVREIVIYNLGKDEESK
jgi:hypothetical protein